MLHANKSTRQLAITATAAAISLFGGSPVGATGYSIKDLGSFGGPLGTNATGITLYGQVVGSSQLAGSPGYTHAFVWTNGVMADMTPGLAASSFATGTNYTGDISGYTLIWNSPTSTAWWHLHGSPMGSLNILGNGIALGINHVDQVVGSGPTGLPMEWDHGTATTLSNSVGRAESINIHNQSVGSAGPAAEWHNGVQTNLVGGIEATAINNAGFIVGLLYDTNNQPRAAAYTNGAWQKLPAPFGTGLSSDAFTVNNNGLIGGYVTPSGTPRAATWATATSQPVLVDTLIPPTPGVVLQYVSGINDYGLMCVTGTLNGVPRSFLLTPK